MKIQARVCDSGDEGDKAKSWTEVNDFPRLDTNSAEDRETAKQWLRQQIKLFNQRLRPDQAKRKLLSTKVLGVSTEHDWEKSNLVTIFSKSGSYDTARCRLCGATGKRFGVGSIRPDSKSVNARICKKGI